VFNLRLTPLDVKKQEFKKTMRGYDPLEVDTFLEMVADEFENMIRERKQLSDEVMKLKIQLRDYQDVETTLRETLVTARESVNESKENSLREADMMIREAELKADKLLADTKLQLAEMKNELVLVKAQKDSFARRLRHLLESQLDIISVLEMDDLGFEKADRKPQPRTRESLQAKRQAEHSPAKAEMSQEQHEVPQKPEPVHEERKDEFADIEWKTRQIKIDEEKGSSEDEHRNRISDQLII
jgi:cell division initiation protein